MLDKKLDKLRDKTLSFGLHFSLGIFDGIVIAEGGEVRWKRGLQLEGLRRQIFLEKTEIIGHPLTYGRIEYLRPLTRGSRGGLDYMRNGKTNDIEQYEDIVSIFEENPKMYNQSELERQQSPHREKLKELLIQFSNYL